MPKTKSVILHIGKKSKCPKLCPMLRVHESCLFSVQFLEKDAFLVPIIGIKGVEGGGSQDPNFLPLWLCAINTFYSYDDFWTNIWS